MSKSTVGFVLSLGVALLAGCATPPAAPTPAPQSAPASSAATQSPAAAPSGAAAEKDAATAMEKRFQEAARSYTVLQKDGKTMYCKREKRIGTTIPTMNCMTEAQLRHQVETMEEYRQRARNAARCTHGAGCGAGG